MNSNQKKIIWDIITGVLLGLAVVPIVLLYEYMASGIWTYIGQQSLKDGLNSMICLTFFGICLIGGIFNPREKDENAHSRRIDYSKRSLLFISLYFLLAFVLLQMTVVNTYPLIDKPISEIQSELELIKGFYSSGLTLYTIGLLSLFWVLIGFFIIRYTHLPEKYDMLKERYIGLNEDD